MNRILLAYSGGLDTTVAIPWLRDRYDAEIITVTVDLGQGLELATIHERALAAGAVRAHVIDARDEFVREYILPARRRGVYEARYTLATALGGMLARRCRDCADGKSHLLATSTESQREGAPGSGGHAWSVQDDAPAQMWELPRAETSTYARAIRCRIPAGPTQVDTNSGGATIRSVTGNAWVEPTEEIYNLTDRRRSRPTADYVDLDSRTACGARQRRRMQMTS